MDCFTHVLYERGFRCTESNLVFLQPVLVVKASTECFSGTLIFRLSYPYPFLSDTEEESRKIQDALTGRGSKYLLRHISFESLKIAVLCTTCCHLGLQSFAAEEMLVFIPPGPSENSLFSKGKMEFSGADFKSDDKVVAVLDLFLENLEVPTNTGTCVLLKLC